ncbi:MAG: hypothetical protein H6862_04500 [Rhodospirillales bacterium]|nr:hypothetical protein [Rhodospirillales bacterium]
MKSKKQPFPEPSARSSEQVSLSLRAFAAQPAQMQCADAGTGEICPFFRDDTDILIWCVDLLSQSPIARALLRAAACEGWSVGLADLQGGGYSFDADQRTILLDRCALSAPALGRSGYFRHSLLMAFVRALRDVASEQRFHSMENHLTPEAFMILARLRNADCDVIALACAWELRGAGHPHVWRHMIGSSEGDMAIAFVKYLDSAPSATLAPAALAAAFRQWFGEDSRMASSDHDALEFLDDVLGSSQTRNPFGHSRLKADLVESLSVLPGGVCYLAGAGREILADPSFLDMEDLVNQTHLLHIMRDLEAVIVADVPFRDESLARRIFPDAPVSRMGV